MDNKSANIEYVIEANNLVKRFGDLTAVNGVSFTIRPGECFGLLGPNGAGKTSIVKMVYGFSPVTGGKLHVLGEDVTRKARAIKAHLGVVPQEDNLDPELSVLDNLMVYAGYFRIDKKEAAERAREILDFMELVEKSGTAVDNLSGGMKRRLTLGRALINQPRLIILDEPTTGLDPYARHIVWQRLRRLKKSGTTMLLTTHYLEEASQLCDRLVILHQGRILEQGTPTGLIDTHVGNAVVELGVGSADRGFLISSVGDLIKDHQVLGDNLLLFTDCGEELAQQVTRLAEAHRIRVGYQRLRPSNLEDVFLKLTGETLVDNTGDVTGGD